MGLGERVSSPKCYEHCRAESKIKIEEITNSLLMQDGVYNFKTETEFFKKIVLPKG